MTSGSVPNTNHMPAHASSTFSRSGPTPQFVYPNAELPFVIVRGELRGSGTLVNSAAKVFQDVTRGAALALWAAYFSRASPSGELQTPRTAGDPNTAACCLLPDYVLHGKLQI
jgi:hypothetical protein